MKYDTIIVGAGSAGGILAARLSEDTGRSVLLLEAGPDYPTLEGLPDDLKYGHAPVGARASSVHPSGSDAQEERSDSHLRRLTGRATNRFQDMEVMTARVAGGGSAINGTVFVRGMPEDYDGWAAAGCDRWGFAEVLPFFRKIETDLDFQDEYHGTKGLIPVRRDGPDSWLGPQVAFREACFVAGFPECPDLNRPDATGIGPIPFNTMDGMRASTAVAYLAEARQRPNLTIQADSVVRRLLVAGMRVQGVAIERAGQPVTIEADELILSAGAIGSPHLLMLSGIGPEWQLREAGLACVLDLPGVGQNLRDHPSVEMRWHSTWTSAVPPSPVHSHQVTLMYTADGSTVRNDVRMRLNSFFLDPTGRLEHGTVKLTQIGVGVRATLQLPEGSGELRVVSADPETQPLLDYRFLAQASDRQRLRQAVRLSISLLANRQLERFAGPRITPTTDDLESDAALDQWMLQRVQTAFHMCGTCKMGAASDRMAVVNQFGQVHGLDNLRVVDASIMPDVVRANTNATTMMIAERMADLIGHPNRSQPLTGR